MKKKSPPLLPKALESQSQSGVLFPNLNPRRSELLVYQNPLAVWDELALPSQVSSGVNPLPNVPANDNTLTAYFTVTRKYRFHAAHRNRELVGTKCESLHGHTYHVDVEIRTSVKAGKSVSLEFSSIDAIFEPHVKQMCHSVLLDTNDPLADLMKQLPNQRLYFMAGETSAENLAKHFYGIGKTAGLYVECVSLRETPSSEVKFRG